MARKLECPGKERQTHSRDGGPSERIVGRLRWYLRSLDCFAGEGYEVVSSWQIAEKIGVNAALVRKDLSRFGEFGTPSYGYRIDFLRERIADILRLNELRAIVWIGAGCYRLHAGAVERLHAHKCHVLALFDSDPDEIGARIGDLNVEPLEALAEAVVNGQVCAAVIAIPGPPAQAAAETLAGLGVKAILNLSGELLVLSGNVRVCSVDIVGELLELSYYC